VVGERTVAAQGVSGVCALLRDDHELGGLRAIDCSSRAAPRGRPGHDDR
jgi:hypothetical protein